MLPNEMTFADVPAGLNAMAVMGHEGDTKTIWNKDNPDEVDVARRTFNDLKKKGYYAYRVVGEKGDKGEIMHEFDPKAERMIMALPMVGG